MDAISNKAVIIGIGLLVTIVITTSILLIVNQIKNIYGEVYEADISIQSRFNEFDKYNNANITAIDMLNAAKRYKDDPLVDIILNNNLINNDAGINTIKSNIENVSNPMNYETKYKTTIEVYKGTDKIKIYFTKI